MHNSAIWIIAALAGVARCAEIQLSAPEQAIIELTNGERLAKGMKPLKPEKKLCDAARAHSENMARQELMEHELDGKQVWDRVKKAGYDFLQVGENIGFNHASAEEMVKAWMSSESHRKNILTANFTEIGVAIVSDAQGQPYYTQVLGRSRNDGPTESAQFRIRNDCDAKATVIIPGGKKATLQPDESATFTVSGTGDFPPLKISLNDETKEAPVKNGARFVIQTARGFEIIDENEPLRPGRRSHSAETGESEK